VSRTLTVAAVIVGVLVFAWTVWAAGPMQTWQRLAALGWLAPLVPLPQLAANVLDTLGWKFSFAARADVLRFPTLYVIRLAGEGFNHLAPSGYVGGEAVKAHLLTRRGVDGSDAAASVVVAKTLMSVAEILFILTGTILILPWIPSAGMRWLAVLVVVLLGGMTIAVLFWLQHRGLFSGLLGVLRRLRIRIAALEAREPELRKIDHEIVRFYREEPRRFAASVAFHFAGWIFGAAEVFFLSSWIGTPVGVTEAIVIDALAHVVKGLTLFIPGSIGFQEGGIVGLFVFFGFPAAAGVGFGLLRRAREIFSSVLGFGLVWWQARTLAGR
jgi:putative membrane protein